MDKIMSARVSAVIVKRIGVLARHLNTSKKAVIERAIEELSERLSAQENIDEFNQTFAAWKRTESPKDIRRRARKAFNDSMDRHHR